MNEPMSPIPLTTFRDQLGRLFADEAQPPAFTAADPQDPWKDYDPEKVREGIRAAAGALAHVDPRALLADIRAARAQEEGGGAR